MDSWEAGSGQSTPELFSKLGPCLEQIMTKTLILIQPIRVGELRHIEQTLKPHVVMPE